VRIAFLFGTDEVIYKNKCYCGKKNGLASTQMPVPVVVFHTISRVHTGPKLPWTSPASRKRERGRLHPTPGGGNTEARQQNTRREMQHLIYFWNIQMQHLQYTFEGRWNTWNKRLKHLWNAWKILENHYHMQHLDKTLANIRMKTPRPLETYACNMHVYATSGYTFATSK
jgi:hypothetical protein